MMKRTLAKTLHIIIIGMSIVFVFACLINATVETTQPEMTKVKVVVLPYIGYTPYFIAQEEGFFAEQGLDVEFVKMDMGTAKALPALVQGELDVIPAAVNPALFNSILRGGHIKIVADQSHITSNCPAQSFVVRKDLLPILQDLNQLRGRRIVVNRLSVNGLYLDKILRRANLTFDDVSILDMAAAERYEGLKAGSIDLAVISDPWITRVLQDGYADVWMPANEIIPEFQYVAMIYGPRLLLEHPEVGERFMVAYLKAARQYNEGKTSHNLDILAKYTGVPQDVLQKACLSPIRPDGHININSVIEFQQWAKEKGWLDGIATEAQFWEPRFVDNANHVLGMPSK